MNSVCRGMQGDAGDQGCVMRRWRWHPEAGAGRGTPALRAVHKAHQELWYLRASLPGAVVAFEKYREGRFCPGEFHGITYCYTK